MCDQSVVCENMGEASAVPRQIKCPADKILLSVVVLKWAFFVLQRRAYRRSGDSPPSIFLLEVLILSAQSAYSKVSIRDVENTTHLSSASIFNGSTKHVLEFNENTHTHTYTNLLKLVTINSWVRNSKSSPLIHFDKLKSISVDFISITNYEQLCMCSHLCLTLNISIVSGYLHIINTLVFISAENTGSSIFTRP